MQRVMLKKSVAPAVPQTHIFCRLSKIDKKTRTVFGRACQEVPDATGEIFDYASSKPYFEKWVEETKQASGGKSLGNIRAMHGNTAAGKATEVTFQDDECAIDIAAKVVDNNEWEKVLEGVYTGFSIGGAYIGEKTLQPDGLTRYTAAPVEISLVDKPCIPTAMFFDVVKSKGFEVVEENGAITKKVFKVDMGDDPPPADDKDKDKKADDKEDEEDATTEKSVEIDGSAEEVAEFGKVLADNKLTLGKVVGMIKTALAPAPIKRFADAANKKYPLDNGHQIAAAWHFINTEKGATGYGEDELKAVKSTIVEAWKETFDNSEPPEVDAEKVKKFFTGEELTKSFYSVASAASMMQSLCYFAEDMRYCEEFQDGAPGVAGKVTVCVQALADVMLTLLEAEMAAKAVDADGLKKVEGWVGDLQKIGARNSKKDIARIQGALDLMVELGGTCPTAEKNAQGGGLNKVAGESLSKALETIDELSKRLKKIEDTPRPSRAVLKVIDKGQDVDKSVTPDALADVQPVLNSRGEVDAVATAMKMVHRIGGRPALPV